MSSYFFIDIFLFLALVFLIYFGYKNRVYEKLFEYFKIFLFLTLSAKLAPYMGTALQKLYITKADTYTTLLLISFVVNYVLFHFGFKYILKFSNNFINNQKVKTSFALILTIFEITIVFTLGLYIFMQVYLVKLALENPLNKSYSYPVIERFYKSFFNDKFTNAVLNLDTSTSSKELIFKNLKNSL